MTLFGKGDFEDITSRWGYIGLGWVPSNDQGSYKKKQQRHRENGMGGKDWSDVSTSQGTLRIVSRSWGEAWNRNSPYESSRRSKPSQHLISGLLASRTMGEYSSVALSLPVCDTSLSSPREQIQGPIGRDQFTWSWGCGTTERCRDETFDMHLERKISFHSQSWGRCQRSWGGRYLGHRSSINWAQDCLTACVVDGLEEYCSIGVYRAQKPGKGQLETRLHRPDHGGQSVPN